MAAHLVGCAGDLAHQGLQGRDSRVEVDADLLVAGLERPLEPAREVALGQAGEAPRHGFDHVFLLLVAVAAEFAHLLFVRQGLDLGLAAHLTVCGVPLARLDGVLHAADVAHQPGEVALAFDLNTVEALTALHRLDHPAHAGERAQDAARQQDATTPPINRSGRASAR